MLSLHSDTKTKLKSGGLGIQRDKHKQMELTFYDSKNKDLQVFTFGEGKAYVVV